MARSTLKNQPTAYPKGPFYIVRFCQLLAAVVVAAEMFYFIWQLKNGGYRVPWMFFFLHGAALVTIITTVITSILHWRHKLSALFNGAVNGVSIVLWVVGFCLLVDAMRETILDACTPAFWGDSTGIMVCRLYKLLFAASLFGLLSTIAAFILDVVVHVRVHPTVTYSRAEQLLGKEDTQYQAGAYESLYDPHANRGVPGLTQSAPSAPSLPLYEAYTSGRRGPPHGA